MENETYEVCGFCERFVPSSAVETIHVRNGEGVQVPIRVCRQCRSPTLTYIQAIGDRTLASNRAVVAALAITLIALGIIFGLVIGSAPGFVFMIMCAVLGACILAVEAATECGR